MPPSSRDDSVKDRRKTNEYAPYTQAGRKAKLTSSRGWSPSIWNALTFWRSGRTSSDDVEEQNNEDAQHDAHTNGATVPTDGLNGSQFDINGDPNDSSFASDLSEGQVSAHLSLESPRHVRFRLPGSDQEGLHLGDSLADHANQLTLPETPVRGSYVAPIPPSSPLRNPANQQDPLAQVADYLASRGGRPLNQIEALGLNTLIQQSVHDAGRPTAAQRSAPFVFNPSSSVSSSPSPIRPTFTTPKTDFAALFASSSVPSASAVESPSSVSQVSSPTSTASPGRKLSRNPNGPLYYIGGGSARPRYRSSAFSASPARKKFTFPRGFGEGPVPNGSAHQAESPSPSDGKRRRVGEERDSSIAQASGSTPSVVNGSSGTDHVPGTLPTTSSTLRFGVSSPGPRAIPNTPARPSPLRQSMRADSSSPSTASPSTANGDSPLGRAADSPSRMRASEIMAEIISDATPKKDATPDVRNPYQVKTRSPTKRTRKPASKTTRPPPRPARPSAPPLPEPKKLSALETIQRTAPGAQAGSKRSRAGMPPPPAPPKFSDTNGIHASTESVGVQAAPSAEKPVVIEIDDGDDEEEKIEPSAKKRKQDGLEKAPEMESKTSATIEVEDVEMDASASASTLGNVVQPSEVIEPDAERQNQSEGKRSIFPTAFGKKASTPRFQTAPKEPSPLRQSFQPDAPSSPPKGSASASPFAPGPSTSTPSAASPFASTSAPFTFAPASTPFTFTPAPGSSTSITPSGNSASIPASGTSDSIPALGSSTSIPVPGASPFAPAPGPSTFASTSSSAPQGSQPVAQIWPTSEVSPPTPNDALAPSSSTPTDWKAVARQQVLDMPVNELPVFVFTFTGSTVVGDECKSQREAACAAPEYELPKYDFSSPRGVIDNEGDIAPASKVQIKAFDYAAAGMKFVEPSGWRCSLCSVANDDKSTKCISCSTPK